MLRRCARKEVSRRTREPRRSQTVNAKTIDVLQIRFRTTRPFTEASVIAKYHTVYKSWPCDGKGTQVCEFCGRHLKYKPFLYTGIVILCMASFLKKIEEEKKKKKNSGPHAFFPDSLPVWPRRDSIQPSSAVNQLTVHRYVCLLLAFDHVLCSGCVSQIRIG